MKNNNLKQFESDARKIVNEAVSLLVAKRRDYGSGGLSGGLHGIAIRMGDKLSRLHNLLGIQDLSFKSKKAVVGNEKIHDTVLDLLNYSLLYLLEEEKRKKK